MEPTLREKKARWRDRLARCLSRPGPLDLLEAALVVAGEEYPDLDVARERARIEALALEGARRAEDLENPFARHEAVRAYLVDELGFKGNAEDYDDPRNSYLNQVLTILFLEVFRGAGFETRGIGLPGHFVMAIEHGGRDLLVDPFHGGRVITEEDCRQLVVRSTGRPSLFRREQIQGAPPEEMFLRMLHNLKRVYLAGEDFERALGVVERLLLMDPEDVPEIRDRGILMAHLGRPGAAVADLEAYLGLAPGAPDAESVRGRLARLRRKLSEAN